MSRSWYAVSALLIGMSAANSATAAAAMPEWLTGVALADAAFNSRGKRLYFDYTFPNNRQIDYFTGKGFRIFRVSVLSDRVLADPGQPDPPGAKLLGDLIAHAAARGAWIIIDLHQFGGMDGLVGRDPAATARFVAFWTRMADRYKAADNVVFGLMNEPNKQSAAEWLSAANEAIAAIRSAGARQLILVPGSYWSGAQSWTKTDNAAVMTGVRDPVDNTAYELHQYLDSNSSGTSPAVVPGSGAEALVPFTTWARAHHAKGFLGEFGFAATPEALKEGGDLLAYMAHNKDVWRGWTYWAAGAWWGSYMFSVEPGKDGSDKPQTAVLERWK